MSSTTRCGYPVRSMHHYHALWRQYVQRNSQQWLGKTIDIDNTFCRHVSTNHKVNLSQLENHIQYKSVRIATMAELINKSDRITKVTKAKMSSQGQSHQQQHPDWMHGGILGALGLSAAYAANMSLQTKQKDNSCTASSDDGLFPTLSSLHSMLDLAGSTSANTRTSLLELWQQHAPSTDCEAHRTLPGSAEQHIHGGIVLPNENASELSSSSSKPRNVMLHRLRSVRGRNLTDKYLVDWNTVLGEGAYGSVHPARLRATGEKVALKKINRHYTNESTFQIETDALLRLYDNGGHPNISGLRDMYEDHSYYYLILDLVTGGEMFEHLINYGAYSEADAARLMFEVSSALAFLHGVGIVHMDLKVLLLLSVFTSTNRSYIANLILRFVVSSLM
jgi:Protein kinase domain